MARKKKRKIKVGRIFILFILISIIIAGLVVVLDKHNQESEPTKKIKNISTIESYEYSLKENATSYYKDLFKKLEKVLNSEEVNEEEYANLVAEMFVADFFNLDNKINKNDVGGKQFVYKNYQSDFEKYAMDGIYKIVESNVYGNREQQLPIVDNVKVEKIGNENYKYGDSNDSNAYKYTFEITYKDDLGYQNSGSLIIIHNDKKLEVASMSDKSSN